MATLSIRSLPDDTHGALRVRAASGKKVHKGYRIKRQTLFAFLDFIFLGSTMEIIYKLLAIFKRKPNDCTMIIIEISF